MRNIKLSSFAIDILLGLAIGAIIALISAFGFLQKFEYITLDGMFKLKGHRSTNDNVVIVEIDDTSLEVLGRWPWPRSYHAGFLQVLNKYEPKFVAFDILFPESDPEHDEILAIAAEERKNLYLASYFVLEDRKRVSETVHFDTLPLPPLNYKITGSEKFLHAIDVTLPVEPLMSAAKAVSIVNVPPDADGSTRHLPLAIEFNGKLYPTLTLQLACDYLGVDLNSVIVKPNFIILPLKDGDIRIPIDSCGRMILNFSGPISTFKRYSYIQLLHEYNKAMKEMAKSILENLNGKIIFVGQTATGTVDLRIVPFSNTYPAVGLHTTALSNILDKDLLREAPILNNIYIILFVSILLSLLVKKGRKVFANLTAMLVLLSTYAIFSFAVFVYFNLWVYTFAPLIAILFTYVAISVTHYEAVRYEKKLLENELLIARKIQQSFLPKSYPEITFLEFAAKCNPARHVGGDLYDFVELGDGKFGIVIGDVSGKGVPAALYMARTISELRTISRLHRDAAVILKSLNELFAKEGMEKSFITMQYIVADIKSKRLILSNGGHNAVLHFIKQQNGIKELDTEGGMPIGVMDGIEFGSKEIIFDKGDILFLYTDGISEAMDRRHREFGLDRLKAVIIENFRLKAEEIMSKIFDEIARFTKGAPQHDDTTLVIVKAI